MLKIILNAKTTDRAHPLLKELDFLPPHSFYQNEFHCLLISIEHYVYPSEENEILSRTIPPANLLKVVWHSNIIGGNWPALMLTACAILLVS